MKNRVFEGFFGKAKLCLCFIFTVTLSSCAVFRPGDTAANQARYYRLTIAVPPGQESDLWAGLPAGSFRVERSLKEGNISEMQLVDFTIKANRQEDLNHLLSQLRSTGIRVISAGTLY